MPNSVSSGSKPCIVVPMNAHEGDAANTGIGAFIRARREALGLAQNALARRAELSPAYLSQIETGKTSTPGAAIRRRIAEALGVRHVDLLVAAGELAPDEVSEVAPRWPTDDPARVLAHELIEQIPDEDVPHVIQTLRGILALAVAEERYRETAGDPAAAP